MLQSIMGIREYTGSFALPTAIDTISHVYSITKYYVNAGACTSPQIISDYFIVTSVTYALTLKLHFDMRLFQYRAFWSIALRFIAAL